MCGKQTQESVLHYNEDIPGQSKHSIECPLSNCSAFSRFPYRARLAALAHLGQRADEVHGTAQQRERFGPVRPSLGGGACFTGRPPNHSINRLQRVQHGVRPAGIQNGAPVQFLRQLVS